MTDLLDINVWLALADANHPHFDAAQHFWHNQAADEVAFCRVTSLGFLRLCTQPGVLSRCLSPSEAWKAYQDFLAVPGICFLPEALETEIRFQSFSDLPDFRPRRWTDAYLAAFAHTSGARLVSFDGDFHTFTGLAFLHLTIDS
ncbi:MAG: TA system VapC family ribonuclease toxin [Puniceicoccaceae bacterium]